MFATGMGLVDLDRRIRKVGESYQKLIAEWRGILPTETFNLAFSHLRRARQACTPFGSNEPWLDNRLRNREMSWKRKML